MNTVRIWDLPTRLFHWLLAVSVIGLIVTAKVGGDAMNWHFRLGYVVFALLLFRLVWGFVGGRWSRFASFFPTPTRLGRYLRGQARPEPAVRLIMLPARIISAPTAKSQSRLSS